VETKAALIASYQVLIGSHAEALSLKEDVLPAARKVFEAAHVGYETGKFGYLDVLDAQQTLFEVSMQYVDALGAYHTALAGAKRLAGWELQ
jgi:cobalt-zinc-cadmium efflux system outer membrane protein